MNLRRPFAYALVAFAFLGLAKAGSDIYRDVSLQGGSRPVVAADPAFPADQGSYVVYFFEGNAPCPVCDQIREMTAAMMATPADPLKHFTMRDINVEVPGNERYILDLGLYSTSVVLAQEADGKIVRWKNLESVWDLADNEPGFREYMLREIDAFYRGDERQ